MIKPKPCSVLSLDIGAKRIGIAGCDPLGISITHLPAIFRNSFEQDLKEFKKICFQRKVEGLIVGNPLDKYGKETNQSIRCKKYGYKLKSIESELLTNLVGNLQQQPELPSTYKIEKNK